MTHLHKHRTLSILKWVSSNFVNGHKTQPWPSWSLAYIEQNPRFYGTKRIVQDVNCDASKKKNRMTRKEAQAQAALLEYLHSTRGLQYTIAENMSKNSPNFLQKILEKVDTDEDFERSITRFLRYHPINEFEPFFESLDLQSHEYGPLLPRGLTFLTDDDLLLENYQVLFSYGILRNKIGKIYKAAPEIFRYNYGVLTSKLRDYERLGLHKSFVGKIIVCSPYLLIGDVNMDFVKVLETLKNVGIEFSWIEEHLSKKSFIDWSHLVALLNLLTEMGHNEEQLARLITQHPGILFEGSGSRTLLLLGFLLKFGLTMNQISSIFQQFPQIHVEKFVSNLRQCLLFFGEIEMEAQEIGKIFYSHPLLLGSCTLKKPNSLLSLLNVGKKRLCKLIQDNPQDMKKWVKGSKVAPLPNSGEEARSKILKIEFLKDLGIEENSKEMEKALKVFRGKGAELQERFDFIVNTGVNRKDVCKMVSVSPQILNLKKHAIEMRINFLLNDLGYPISYLVAFPSFLSHSLPRVKLRIAMYNWLKEQGVADPMLALSTIIACSDKLFVKQYVNRHHKGPEVWEELKKNNCSD